MEIRKGQRMIKLPEFTAPGTTELFIYSLRHPKTHPGGYWEVIQQIDHNAMLNAGAPTGRMTYCIIRDHKKQRDILWISESPKRAIHASFRYCPVAREI